MTYKESPHRHQSELLDFLPNNYNPYKKVDGVRIFGVLFLENGIVSVKYQNETPLFGGYISDKENIYGNSTFCRNATRNHIKHLRLYGEMPHLVFFETEETAKKAGFRKCKVCLK